MPTYTVPSISYLGSARRVGLLLFLICRVTDVSASRPSDWWTGTAPSSIEKPLTAHRRDADIRTRPSWVDGTLLAISGISRSVPRVSVLLRRRRSVVESAEAAYRITESTSTKHSCSEMNNYERCVHPYTA